MGTSTMLGIIAVAALCFLWAIVRVRRRVIADDRQWQERVAEIARDREAKQRAFAEAGERLRNSMRAATVATKNASDSFAALGVAFQRADESLRPHISPAYNHPSHVPAMPPQTARAVPTDTQ